MFRLGTEPVRSAYWKVTGVPPKGTTYVFRRYLDLPIEVEEDRVGYINVMINALLGFPQQKREFDGILNDSWVVNLKRKEKENVMMDAFLKGFADQSQELKKSWGKETNKVNVTQELKDLLKVYEESEKHLQKKEDECLRLLNSYMRAYIRATEERNEISDKLHNLRVKLVEGSCEDSCGDCEEDDE